MAASNEWKFETKQLHIGQEEPDPASDARAVPIYQTTSYVFKDTAQAAARFSLSESGNIYGRLTNTTQEIFEKRIAALAGGVGALALASGAAAVYYAFLNICKAGDHLVSSKTIYGGTYNLLANTLPDYGISTTFVNADEEESFLNAFGKIRRRFLSKQSKSQCNMIDIEKWQNCACTQNSIDC